MVDPSSPNYVSIPKDRHAPPLPWWKYLPLMILCVATVLAAGAGWYVTWGVEPGPDPNAAPPATWTPPESTTAPTTGIAALNECRTTPELPSASPWIGDEAASSEAAFQENMTAAGNNPYVEGQDGFVFWGDVQANNFSQALGRRYLSDAELTAWADSISSLEEGLEEQGIPFVFMVSPAKWSIYADGLPAWSQELMGATPLDQLLLSHPELPVVDVRGALRDAAETAPVFSRVNSHWNDFGSLVAWNQSVDCLNALYPDLPAFAQVDVSGTIADPAVPNEFADYGFEAPVPSDWILPEYAEQLHEVTLTTNGTTTVLPGGSKLGFDALPGVTETPDAPDQRTVLILRDSFGTLMSAQWDQVFGHTIQVRHNIDSGADDKPDIAALVAEYKPDLVIFQMAERHLNWSPLTVTW